MRALKTGVTTRPRLLMWRLQYFSVSYSINPWMDPQGWASAGGDLWQTADRHPRYAAQQRRRDRVRRPGA
jgi:hypothetical protein